MAHKVHYENNDGSKRLIGYGGRGAKQKMLWALKQLNWGDHPTNPSFTYYRGLDSVYYFESRSKVLSPIASVWL